MAQTNPYHISPEERLRILERAKFNLFEVPAEYVTVDLLTDSGTHPMSEAQWEAICRAEEDFKINEAYGNPKIGRELKTTIKNLFRVPYVLLVNQGRVAENVFGNVMQKKPGLIIAGNTPFDTTRIHIESRGGIIEDFTSVINISPMKTFGCHPSFLGNVDLVKLFHFLEDNHTNRRRHKKIAYILITATCNTNAGQPVSLRNIDRVCTVAHSHGIPVFLDLARYAENAFFIKERELGFGNKSVKEIISLMVKNADGFLVSGKKDALGNMGGFMGFKSWELTEKVKTQIIQNVGLELERELEGPFDWDTFEAKFGDQISGYGGMSGRGMAALNQGIIESTDETYLKNRISQVKYLAKSLFDLEIPTLPPGGHAVFVDAGTLLAHLLRWDQYPGHALALALYIEGGVRSVEVGSLMQGPDPKTGHPRQAPQELLRLAIPRRMYAIRDMDYITETFRHVMRCHHHISPVVITGGSPPHFSRHFSWEYKKING